MTVFEVWYAVLLSVRATDGGGGWQFLRNSSLLHGGCVPEILLGSEGGCPANWRTGYCQMGGPPHKIPIFPLHKNQNPPTPHKKTKEIVSKPTTMHEINIF